MDSEIYEIAPVSDIKNDPRYHIEYPIEPEGQGYEQVQSINEGPERNVYQEMQGGEEYQFNNEGQAYNPIQGGNGSQEMQEYQIGQEVQEYPINNFVPTEQTIPSRKICNVTILSKGNQMSYDYLNIQSIGEYPISQSQNTFNLIHSGIGGQNMAISTSQYYQSSNYLQNELIQNNAPVQKLFKSEIIKNNNNNKFNEYPVTHNNNSYQKIEVNIENTINEIPNKLIDNIEIRNENNYNQNPQLNELPKNEINSKVVEETQKLTKNKGPNDSIPKEHIERKSDTSSYINIPKFMSFPNSPSTKENFDSKIKQKELSEQEELHVEKNEIFTEKEPVLFQRGMDSRQYKFSGERALIEPQEGLGKIKLSEKEIQEELSKRAHKKQNKEIKYEIIDKYYALAEYEMKNGNNEEVTKSNIKMEMYINSYSGGSVPGEMMVPMDKYSKYLFEQINQIRAAPQSFIQSIQDAKKYIKPLKDGGYSYDGRIKVALSEGVPAFDEAIGFLKSQKPMEKLKFSRKLIPPTPKDINEMKDLNVLKTKIENMINNGINIKSYWRDMVKDPKISLLLMIIDDTGARKGTRRNDILNPNLKYIGISSVVINGEFACYITLSPYLNNS